MGREKECVATWNGERSAGRALLESTEVLFRGTFRVKLPLATLTAASARGGVLRLEGPAGTLALALGDEAAAWLERIRHPKSVIDKLGVKPAHSVSVLAVPDDGFRRDLAARAASVSEGRAKKGSDLVFLGAATKAALAKLKTLRAAIAPDGAVWVVWPKGRPALREDDVRAAAKAAGLVDVKVVAFSATHSALKLVIPLRDR